LFFAAENASYFGNLKILDIQLQKEFLQKLETEFEIIEIAELRSIFKPRNEFSHKGQFGHALLVAGSEGKMGAAILSARAAMRSGLGMLTVSIPRQYNFEMHACLPEAMVVDRAIETIDYGKFASIGIGPGLGTSSDSELIVKEIIDHFKKPILIDADAINILAANPGWLKLVPADSILTPHPKEFDRLFGASANEFERWRKAVQISNLYPITILVKGHHTLIATKGKAYFNNTGNAGLAKAGSGDSLSGIITALLAQGYASAIAAILGVYIHGMAADLALDFESTESMLASDTIERIGDVFKLLAAKE